MAGKAVDFVVGNPPYVRLEDVPPERMLAYRAACPTMTGRSDLYVGFFERGLRALKPDGVLAFICADRWMRNQYGRHLRALIATDYSVDVTVTMHDVDAFEDQVSAYPAITVLRRAAQGPVVVADTRRAFGPRMSRICSSGSRTGDAAADDRCEMRVSRTGSPEATRGRRVPLRASRWSRR